MAGRKLGVSRIKLALHVQKLTRELQVVRIGEESHRVVFSELITAYPQYGKEDEELLLSAVSEIVDAFVLNNMRELQMTAAANTAATTELSRIASLNQSMVNTHKSALSVAISSAVHSAVTSGTKRLLEETSSLTDDAITTPSGAPPSAGALAAASATSQAVNGKRRKTSPLTSVANTGGFLTERPKTRLRDLVGLESVVSEVEKLTRYPLDYFDVFNHLGVSSPCGILLYGPSGCGKTTLAHAIAGETGLPFFKASGPELVGGTSGESETRVRQLFEAASAAAPSVLFIDSLDVIAAKKDNNSRGMDRRIVAQLFDSIDAISNLGRDADDDTLSSVVPEESTTTTPATTVTEEEMQLDTPSSVSPVIPSQRKFVILIAATNKPENIDPGVRGRFARETALPVPDAAGRAKILQFHTRHMVVSPTVSFQELARITPGYVGADLQSLVREAGLTAVCRIVQSDKFKSMAEVRQALLLKDSSTDTSNSESIYNDMAVEMSDFVDASKSIQPSAKREGFATAPNVTWSDVGALSEVREELRHNVLEPIANPERFRALGLEVPAGVLFFGPPGCGKTLLAKALANHSGANFISVKGPELLNMYVGESESKVRQVFARARSSAPCVIFFDELDALCPKRSSGFDGGGSGNGVTERVVNQLLTELDGLESRKGVYIIGATNRLELIDDAMLRPGRLGNLLYVPLPKPDDRVSILQALTRKVAVEFKSDEHVDGVDLEIIARDERTNGFSGADLNALVREAGLSVIKELSAEQSSDTSSSGFAVGATEGEYEVHKMKARHFEAALCKVRPSVKPQDRIRYDLVQQYLREGLSAIEALKKAHDAVQGL